MLGMWFLNNMNFALTKPLQGLHRYAEKLGLATVTVQFSYIKSFLLGEFHDRIGFQERFQRDQSTLVYDTSFEVRYGEAAINCWGVTDDQLICIAAQLIRCHTSAPTISSWSRHVDDLVDDEQLDELLQKFVSMLRTSKYGEKKLDPTVLALTSLLFS